MLPNLSKFRKLLLFGVLLGCCLVIIRRQIIRDKTPAVVKFAEKGSNRIKLSSEVDQLNIVRVERDENTKTSKSSPILNRDVGIETKENSGSGNRIVEQRVSVDRENTFDDLTTSVHKTATIERREKFQEFQEPQTTESVGEDFHVRSTIVNPHDFKYVVNNENLCLTDPKPVYIVYCITAPKNFARRQVMRNIWSQPNVLVKYPSRIIFVLGLAPDPDVNKAIKEEGDKFGDIVQEDFHDHYKNLTLKGEHE
ncbi:unnamed protein product [Dimorphilus gyrociliatus]|uniref:Hexosyltransferase n=1 Tax=Dimorphilus gyrociliatus TaxID=2664684 RepID=A0A7I8W9F6_9ANNE|nr:unnamed protein product [Dimorphilus gyrociliatus]